MACSTQYNVPDDLSQLELVLDCAKWGMTCFEWTGTDWITDEEMPYAACRFEDKTCEEYFGSQVPGGCIDNIAVDCTVHGPYPVVRYERNICDSLDATCYLADKHSPYCY